MAQPKVAIVGAGSIGCLVGGALASHSMEVHFLGRAAKGEALQANGMEYRLLNGTGSQVKTLNWASDVTSLPSCDFYLICVKSQDTAAVCQSLKDHVAADAEIVSLQNGLDNVSVIRTALPSAQVHAGMVAFNVVERPSGTFSVTTEGDIYLVASPSLEPLKTALEKAGIHAHQRVDMEAVQFSKLLLNLNNALNALSGVPLAEQLKNRAWRRVLAAMMEEGQAVANAAQVPLANLGKVKTSLIPTILRLPNFLFLRIAASMVKIDPAARSSMADDLALGRNPEIDHLNGKIVSLGRDLGVPTPVNAATVQAVHDLFEGNSQTVRPETLLCG